MYIRIVVCAHVTSININDAYDVQIVGLRPGSENKWYRLVTTLITRHTPQRNNPNSNQMSLAIMITQVRKSYKKSTCIFSLVQQEDRQAGRREVDKAGREETNQHTMICSFGCIRADEDVATRDS